MAAVHQITHTIHARAIVCWTKSGSTGLRAARERPEAPIIVLTPLVETARRLALAWGLHCVTTEDAHDLDDVVDRAARIAFQEGFAKPGDRIVVTAGVPLGTPGSTNLLRVTFVGPTSGLNALTFDVAGQRIDMPARTFELRIQFQRLAVQLQRGGLVAVILHHVAKLEERSELARIEQDHVFRAKPSRRHRRPIAR